MPICPTEWEGVATDGSWLLTRNRVPGTSVYGESLPREGGIEYRRWDANRSKLAAYLKCGGRVWAPWTYSIKTSPNENRRGSSSKTSGGCDREAQATSW